MTMKSKIRIHLALGFALVAFLLACQGATSRYRGRVVPEDQRLSIEAGGPHQVLLVKRGAAIEYAYERQAETLELQGTVSFSRAKGPNDYLLDHFYLRMYPLDNEGQILDSHLVVNRTRVLNADQFAFKRQFVLPDETVGLAWSVWSRWSRPGSQGYAAYTVWDSPLK